MVSVAVSQVGMTEMIFFVDHGVKVNGQYYCDVLSCRLSRCFQQSNVSQNVVSSQNNNVAYGEIGRFCVL